MTQYLAKMKDKKVEEKYWRYVSKKILSCEPALPIERYRGYIR